MPIKGATYRYKKGTDIRLAFDSKGNVIEAVNTKTGKVHTPAEFKADAKARSTRMAQAPTKKANVKTQSKGTSAEEAAEAEAEAELTPLGIRTRAGFVKRFGEQRGEQKFQDALDQGILDRTKMEVEPADEPPDEDETDEFTGGPPMPMSKKKKMMVMPAGMMGGM